MNLNSFMEAADLAKKRQELSRKRLQKTREKAKLMSRRALAKHQPKSEMTKRKHEIMLDKR